MTQNQDKVNWLGRKLRESAESREYSSAMIAQRLHKSGALVRSWWTGRRRIALDDLKNYAILVDYHISYFLSEEATTSPEHEIKHDVNELLGHVVQVVERIRCQETSVEKFKEKLSNYLVRRSIMSKESVDNMWKEILEKEDTNE